MKQQSVNPVRNKTQTASAISNGVKKFKRRWARVNEFQDNELRKLTIAKKLYQLISIVRLAMGMKLDFSEDREKRKVRSRWIFLKRGNS